MNGFHVVPALPCCSVDRPLFHSFGFQKGAGGEAHGKHRRHQLYHDEPEVHEQEVYADGPTERAVYHVDLNCQFGLQLVVPGGICETGFKVIHAIADPVPNNSADKRVDEGVREYNGSADGEPLFGVDLEVIKESRFGIGEFEIGFGEPFFEIQ